jgi:hypothetical protein
LQQGIAQGGGNRLLTHQLVEPLGPIFVVEGFVGHNSQVKFKKICLV